MPPDLIEQRLAAIEATLADIQRRLPPSPAPPEPWWKRFEGAFDDNPAFDDVIRYGREYNESTRPGDEPPDEVAPAGDAAGGGRP